MKHIVTLVAGALALGAGCLASSAPASADEQIGYGRRVYREPVVRYRAASRPRRIVREVIVERPVYRTRVVREVVVERPVIYRPRRIVREVFVEPYGYGPPPFVYGPPRPRFAYGPGFLPPPPIRPVGFGFGFGPGFGYGPFF
ncbi:MAG: hypothetical protein PGN34_19765 [Methylobacterium frigidaeris]